MTRRKFAKLGRYDALTLAAAIWFLAKFLRYAFPPLFDELKLVYGVSNAELGAAFTGFMIVYAVMQFPSGFLADRFGPVRVIAAGVLVAAGGALVVVIGGPFLLLVAAMLVMGAGTGAHKTVAITLLARVYPTRTGRTLGLFDTVGTYGGVIAPVVVALLLGAGADWRTIFLASGVAGIGLAVAFSLRVPRRLPEERTDSEQPTPSLRTYAAPFGNRRFLAFVVVTLGFSFAYNGIVAFLPLYLVAEANVSSATASLLYSLLFVVSVVQMVTGELADHIGRLSVIGATLSLATASLAVLLAPLPDGRLVGVPVLTVIGVVGLGLGSHGFRPVRGVHLAALLPDSHAGGGLGTVRTALMGAGAVAPALVGAIADSAGFQAAFLVLFGALAVAVSVVGLLLATDNTS